MGKTAVVIVSTGMAGANAGDRVPAEFRDSALFETLPVRSGGDVLELLKRRSIDLAVLNSDGNDSDELLSAAISIRQHHRRMPLVYITSQSSESQAIAALRAGIDEYLTRPISKEALLIALRECVKRSRSRFEFQAAALPVTLGDMIGPGTAMRNLRSYLGKVALSDVNVMITGETGTGKELAAKFVHERSSRRLKPLVSMNCAAIPDSLLESELFGYERGAFTGAHAATEGKLKAADGGTVFLDEIGDMSQYAQAKILRAIESREIQRLGSSKGIPINIRIIAATNRELETLVERGEFRRDLYFRLNVARVHLPALRERKEDIPPLLSHYLNDMNMRYGRQVRRFTEGALDSLLAYQWPGNVRELKNLLEAIFVEIVSGEIALSDFPAAFRRQCEPGAAVVDDERSLLVQALLATNWNKSRAADKLNWSRMTLYRKIAKHNVQKAEESGQTLKKQLSVVARTA